MREEQLKIIDSQKYDTHQDTNETIVQGTVAARGDSTYITFKQKDESFGVMITTLIKIKKGVVSVKRQGGIQSSLVFDIIKPQETLYQTPMGEMEICIETHEIENRTTQQNVHLKIGYTIFMQGKKTSENMYFIQNI